MEDTLQRQTSFTEDEFNAILSYKGWGRVFPESNTITFTGAQLMEIERVLYWYTEALAQYNMLGAGRQTTLDTLNEALELIYKVEEN
jgi:hypothetical protein